MVVVVHAVYLICVVSLLLSFCFPPMQPATCNCICICISVYLHAQSSQQQPATQLCSKVPVLHCDDCAGHRHNLEQALQMPSVSESKRNRS